MELLDYTVSEMFQVAEEELTIGLSFVLTHLRPREIVEIRGKVYQGRDPYRMTFADVINFQRQIRSLDADTMVSIIETLFEIPREILLEIRSTEFFPMWNYFISRMKYIDELRQKAIPEDPDPDWKRAGGDRLQKYGALGMIDKLAGGNILIWDEIQNLPYHLVFMKICLEHDRGEILEKFAEIKRGKK